MSNKSPVPFHPYWGRFASASVLPNTTGGVTESALQIGDYAYVNDEEIPYVCTDATAGSAVWVTMGAGASVVGNKSYIVVGNSLMGDTDEICHYLDDGDGVQLAAAIAEANLTLQTVFIRPGTYDFSTGPATTPITINYRVVGSGSGTKIVTKAEGDISLFLLATAYGSVPLLENLEIHIHMMLGLVNVTSYIVSGGPKDTPTSGGGRCKSVKLSGVLLENNPHWATAPIYCFYNCFGEDIECEGFQILANGGAGLYGFYFDTLLLGSAALKISSLVRCSAIGLDYGFYVYLCNNLQFVNCRCVLGNGSVGYPITSGTWFYSSSSDSIQITNCVFSLEDPSAPSYLALLGGVIINQYSDKCMIFGNSFEGSVSGSANLGLFIDGDYNVCVGNSFENATLKLDTNSANCELIGTVLVSSTFTDLGTNNKNIVGTISGDVTGTQLATVVEKIRNLNINPSISPTDGYVLTWVAASSFWDALAPSSGGGLTQDEVFQICMTLCSGT